MRRITCSVTSKSQKRCPSSIRELLFRGETTISYLDRTKGLTERDRIEIGKTIRREEKKEMMMTT